MMRKSIQSFAFTIILASSLSENAVRNAIRDYDRKVCANQPTCHLLNETYLSNDRFNLGNRDCMCDAACSEYRDCCLDSPYYSFEEQSKPPYRHCSPSEKVYMKSTCPETWSDQVIANKCAQFFLHLSTVDVSTHIPATNPTTNVTYSNRYCAECNGDNDYELWTEKPACGEVQEEFLTSEGSIRSDARRSVNKYSIRNATAREIWQNAVKDQNTGDFMSRYNGKTYACEMQRVLPTKLKGNVRACVPNLIETCNEESNAELVQKCASYTSIVYLTREKRYRNMDCAKCNGIQSSEVGGCLANLKLPKFSVTISNPDVDHT